MNITCSQCLKEFSITAEQLGTRGKCPHCRATIKLPRSTSAELTYDPETISPPSQFSQTLFCVLVTLVLHGIFLGAIVNLPWENPDGAKTGDGTVVTIGKLSNKIELQTEIEEFDLSEIFKTESDQSFGELNSDLLTPIFEGELNNGELPASSSFSSSIGSESLLDFWSVSETAETAGDSSEAFEAMVARLNEDGLDIVITFDSTRSMQGEIDQVKNQIHRIGTVLFRMIEKTRIGVCSYRDLGDSFVVDGLPLTDNLAEIILYLEKIQAEGGGDEPEAVEAGLRWATEQRFRASARKVILLFGDAPPRPSQNGLCQDMAMKFRLQGGKVNTVTCRKPNRLDEFVQIATSGGGEAFLTADEKEIMAQLIVLVFGSQHRLKVIEAFDLLNFDEN
ncbi:MAG: hypothetical protein AAGA30_03745 [Planctomycetota bacterium]